MNATTVAVDLAKNVFQRVVADAPADSKRPATCADSLSGEIGNINAYRYGDHAYLLDAESGSEKPSPVLPPTSPDERVTYPATEDSL